MWIRSDADGVINDGVGPKQIQSGELLPFQTLLVAFDKYQCLWFLCLWEKNYYIWSEFLVHLILATVSRYRSVHLNLAPFMAIYFIIGQSS